MTRSPARKIQSPKRRSPFPFSGGFSACWRAWFRALVPVPRRRVGDKMIVGVSAHNPEEARRAYEGGADYLGAGAVFGSTTKTNVTALSHEALRAICDAVPIPVVAIGGITRENLPQLACTGVAGVAVVSAIFAAEDITAASRELRALSDAMTQTE